MRASTTVQTLARKVDQLDPVQQAVVGRVVDCLADPDATADHDTESAIDHELAVLERSLPEPQRGRVARARGLVRRALFDRGEGSEHR